MRVLLIISLFCVLSGVVNSDINIYGPNGENLGPDGDPFALDLQPAKGSVGTQTKTDRYKNIETDINIYGPNGENLGPSGNPFAPDLQTAKGSVEMQTNTDNYKILNWGESKWNELDLTKQ